MVAGFAWVIGKGVRVWFIDGVGAVATPRAPFTSAGISMRPVAPSGPTALLPGSALLPHSDSALAPPLHPVPALPLLHISPSRLIFLFRFVAADGEGRHRRCGPGCEGGRVSEEGVSGWVGGWEGKTRRAVNQGVEASEFHPDSSRSVRGAKSAPVASVSHQTP